ncbi:MAG TPA: sensor histidine kinase [Rhodopila sp.]|uniref:sensor histidine kinase n=1 Tax=Rhodopila sp. TaxID=2480087 RepID=UPI002C1C0D1F|nr:sensor histidine kinase [Rhodopila sp.]HVY15085.1 sensor histidine kinase [Rhodopila sp.]
MTSLSDRMIKIIAWRSEQPAPLRWLLTGLIFAAAALARTALGPLHGANPALSFYPAIIVVATVLGWREAAVLLVLSIGLGICLFLPPGLYLLPITWAIVGALNILIIATLKNLARQLQTANEQQRVLFAELQHRVANTLQSAAGSIELAKRHVEASPSRAAETLDEASRRVAVAADVHRRLNDPATVRTALRSVLRDAVASVIDPKQVKLVFDIEQPALTLDQMSTLTMIIIECAHNAQKHVFEAGLGSMFLVSLKAPRPDRGLLVIRDDGPGMAAPEAQDGRKLGQKLIRRLAASLGASVSLTPGRGTEFVISFPLETAGQALAAMP